MKPLNYLLVALVVLVLALVIRDYKQVDAFNSLVDRYNNLSESCAAGGYLLETGSNLAHPSPQLFGGEEEYQEGCDTGSHEDCWGGVLE